MLVCAGVLFNERVIKVDDPCGAISVHGYCGWFGAVSVGIFADGAYGAGWNGVGAATYLGKAGQGVTGLIHGDVSQFLLQLGGATLCAVYAFGLTYVVFKVVNAMDPDAGQQRGRSSKGWTFPNSACSRTPEEEGIPATQIAADAPTHDEEAMTLIKSIVRPNKVDDVKDAVEKLGVSGMTVTEVRGHGKQKGHTAIYRGQEYAVSLLPKMEIEIVVPDAMADETVKVIAQAARTGEIGDGRVFVMPVHQSYRIRTGDLERD